MLLNWLQVSAHTKLSEIDEAESNEFESEMTSLFGFITQDQTFELVFPGKHTLDGETYPVKSVIEESFASASGDFAIARVLLDVWFDPSVEEAFAVGFAVKASVEIESRTFEIKLSLGSDALQVFDPRW